MKASGIAVFDLDGTITRKDTFLEFIRYVKGGIRFYIGIIVLSPYILLYYLRLLPNDKLKERFFRYFFKGMSESYLCTKGNDFSVDVLPVLCYHKALERIHWHQSQKHRIIILTASSNIWLSEWCKVNGVELIGTRFEVNANRYTGRILGKNCHGLQKKHILETILQEGKYSETFGYGDSRADKHFLQLLEKRFYREFSKSG